jgi:hypothetical protein
VHVLAAVLALMFGQRAGETERKVLTRRVFAARARAVTRINPRSVAFAAEQIGFGQRLGRFLFFELLHPTK